MTVIKDGSGTSLLARVDNQNRLHTATINQAEVSHVSIHSQEAFSIIGSTTIIGSSEKTILILINNPTSQNKIAISTLRISLVGEVGKVTTFKAYLGRTTYNVGGTVVTPVNLYANSPNILDVSVYSDNPTLVVNDRQIQQAYEESTTTLDISFEGSIILPPNSSLRITVTGDATASGTKSSFTRFIYNRIDDQLHV